MTKKISSLGNILMGILLMLGPWFIFGVCSTEEKVMKCFWSCRSLFVLGALAVLIGMLILISKEKCVKNEVIISMAITIMSILVPYTIIGGCMKETMHCNVITYPVVYAICGINLIVQIVSLIKLPKRGTN